MKTSAAGLSQPVFPKQHENKLQELRHERKAESLHLDGLKKALRQKLDDSQKQVA
jgi:hypothetical protein